MKKLLAEMRHYDGSLVISGDVYITIIKVTDISRPVVAIERTTTGVLHLGSGVWAYDNPYADPGSDVYIAAFEFSERPDGWSTDYDHVVTGAIGTDDSGDWSIIAAGGIGVGEIRSPNSRRIEISLGNGRKYNIRRR